MAAKEKKQNFSIYARKLYTAQMRSIITGCSGIIVVNLVIRYKKIEKQWRQEVISKRKHEIGDFKRIDLENI